MKISAKTDYACRAMLELAQQWPNKNPVQIQEISRHQRIPIKFLTLILLDLKQLGYVRSMRGKNGGYVLQKAPSEVYLSDIVRQFNGSDTQQYKRSAGANFMAQIWLEVDKKFYDALSGINFESILNRKREDENILVFQI